MKTSLVIWKEFTNRLSEDKDIAYQLCGYMQAVIQDIEDKERGD